MSVLFLFIDGIGLGTAGEFNPLTTNEWKGLNKLNAGKPWHAGSDEIREENHLFIPIDANLDVEGLPQSGTGQVALFSGKNASKEIEKHFGPYPHSQTKKFIEEYSLFQRANERGFKVSFLNAYPEIFFRHAEKRNRWSTTTLMCKMAGVPLNTVNEVRANKALTAEIRRDYWRKQLYPDISEITDNEAAKIALEVSNENDITLFEYYLTDKAGHTQKPEEAFKALERLDSFLVELLRMKSDELTIILTSDHGNIEDLSVKTHTRNTVPLAVLGPLASAFSDTTSLMDVTPMLIRSL